MTIRSDSPVESVSPNHVSPEGVAGSPQRRPWNVLALIKEFIDRLADRRTLFEDIRHKDDLTERANASADTADAAAEDAKIAHETAQAKVPERNKPLPRQMIFGAGCLALDEVACFLAAEVFDEGTIGTAVISLFLLLGVVFNELWIDIARREHRWRQVRIAKGALFGYVALLAALRCDYLLATGSTVVGAALGAALLTAVTAFVVFVLYRIVRSTESIQCFKLRRVAKHKAAEAHTAHEEAGIVAIDRDEHVNAFLRLMRPFLLDRVLEKDPDAQHSDIEELETQVRQHLVRAEKEAGR